MRYPFWLPPIIIVLSVLIVGSPLFAGETQVSRVSYVSGEVSYLRGDLRDSNNWNVLKVNVPLMTGDSLYTSKDGHAEINFGLGNVSQMDQDTGVDIINLTGDIIQLGVNEGNIDLKIRGLPSGGAVEVDTVEAAATVQAVGSYRISAGKDWASYGVVSGELTVSVNNQQITVQPGERLELITRGDEINYSIVSLGDPSPFDNWAAERDGRYDRSISARYVNNDVIGYQDLDDAGHWSETPDYGNVWIPDVPPDWAPYRDGRWIWEDPYGWTWVSYEPWGWAPYHYGRWIHHNRHWCWVPPAPPWYVAPPAVMAITPFYAPALVAFFGGPGWNIGISLGGPAIGWVPLAVGEPYYYPWQPRPAAVNISYMNLTVINAATVVSINTYIGGSVVPLRINPSALIHPPILGIHPKGILPTRASLSVYPQQRGLAPPVSVLNRPMVARLTPPPSPVPFMKKIGEIRSTGRPVLPSPSRGMVGKPFIAPAANIKQGQFISAFTPRTGGSLKPAGQSIVTRQPAPLQGIAPKTGRHGMETPLERPAPAQNSAPVKESPAMQPWRSQQPAGMREMPGAKETPQNLHQNFPQDLHTQPQTRYPSAPAPKIYPQSMPGRNPAPNVQHQLPQNQPQRDNKPWKDEKKQEHPPFGRML